MWEVKTEKKEDKKAVGLKFYKVERGEWVSQFRGGVDAFDQESTR